MVTNVPQSVNQMKNVTFCKGHPDVPVQMVHQVQPVHKVFPVQRVAPVPLVHPVHLVVLVHLVHPVLVSKRFNRSIAD